MTTSPLPPPNISFSPEHRSMTGGLSLPRQRMRCASCSESSFSTALEDSSFLLDIRPRHYRTPSICDQIQDETLTGTIVYFCRSRGHGFIRPDRGSSRRPSIEFSCGHNNNLNNNNTQESEQDHFLHISDIDSDYVPRKGDKVTYSLCPIPPKFEKFQAVNVRITSMSPLPHARWDAPQMEEEGRDELENDLPPPGDI